MGPIDSHTVMTDPRGHRILMSLLYRQLSNWAAYNTIILKRMPQKVAPGHMEETQKLYNEWLETFVADYEDNVEVRMHIFVELSRAWWILNYNQLVDEQTDIENRRGIPNPDRDYMIFYHPVNDPKWVIKYNQQNIMDALLEITSFAKYIPSADISEVRQFVDLLLARNAVFFCEECGPEILNVGNMYDEAHRRPHRDYLMFTSIYFRAILRRFLYLDTFPVYKGVFQIPTHMIESCQQWFEEDVCGILGSQGFEEMYKKACEAAYDFPGDLEWFKFRNPVAGEHRGSILNCIRKDTAKRFFSEYRISKEVVLAAMNAMDHQGHCSRTMLFLAIDAYMMAMYNLEWADAVIVPLKDLENKQIKLYRPKSPTLVETFSLFQCYHQKQVYRSDNIYETLAMWFYIVKKHYNGQIFGVNLQECIEKVIPLM